MTFYGIIGWRKCALYRIGKLKCFILNKNKALPVVLKKPFRRYLMTKFF